MSGKVERICPVCGSNAGFMPSDDGFFYCGYCDAQADDLFDTAVDEEEVFLRYSRCNQVRRTNVIAAEPISQVKLTTSQYLDHPNILVDDTGNNLPDEDGLTVPSDFGSFKKNFSYEEYYSEIRSRYITGIQVMIQLQCQTLVEKFNVSPLIVGIVGTLWLRFLASTRIMADDWADKAVHESEAQTQGEGEAKEFQPSATYGEEPVNLYGKRITYVWYRSLRSTCPISCSLAISFLACHVAREAILPSDMLKRSLEGKLPYFSAFAEIEQQLGPRSEACPIRASLMFRPTHAISSQKLEAMAANIAKKIGLELPPVNFYAIASRYCQQLSLPSEDIIPSACRICEWSTPAELYLSANEDRIPTCACVMSILIVAIRRLFDINGYGLWESSLPTPNCSSSRPTNADTATPSHVETAEDANVGPSSNNPENFGVKFGNRDSRLSAVELLHILEAKHKELNDAPGYSSSLSTYLQYCKDVVFSGLGPSHEDLEEEKLVEELWEYYQKNKHVETLDDNQGSGGLNDKPLRGKSERRQGEVKKEVRGGRSTQDSGSTSENNSSDQDVRGSRPSKEPPKDKAIKQLKVDMEENKFCYIPPRVKVKKKDYVHYARRQEGVYVYAVHADYYILLRSCAKVALVETRIMHTAVLSLERRLQGLEKRIDSLVLHLEPDVVLQNQRESSRNGGNDPMDLST